MYPGYQLHGFDIDRGGGAHIQVFVLEKNGVPAVGTNVHYGKNQQTVSVVLDDPTTRADNFHCDSVSECKTKLATLEAQAAVPPVPFHCDSVSECKTKLQNIQQLQ